MESGTNTGKFPNCISCILHSGDTEINFALLFWSIDLISKKLFRYIYIYSSLKNQTIFSVELFMIIIAVIFEK